MVFACPSFIRHRRYLDGAIHSKTRFYTCEMPSLYPATREQTIYGPKTRQISKNARDPNSAKYGLGRETTDTDRKNRHIQFPLG